MNIVHVVLLAIIEGVTEFLPISSTGHLILTTKLLGITVTEFTKSFDIIIQLGAIMAVVSLYAGTIMRQPHRIIPILVGFLPTGILGIVFYRIIKTHLLGNDLVVTAALAGVGALLILLERWWKSTQRTNPPASADRLPLWKYAVIGLFQSASMIPGVSRSAASIVGGILMGMKRETAVEFSFLLAVPTMAAATGLDLLKSSHAFSRSEAILLLTGFVVSWATARIVVAAFLKGLNRTTFAPFGWYRIAVAAAYWSIMRL